MRRTSFPHGMQRAEARVTFCAKSSTLARANACERGRTAPQLHPGRSRPKDEEGPQPAFLLVTGYFLLVELRGFEPLAFSLRM